MADRPRRSIDEEIHATTGTSKDPFAAAVRATRMPIVISDPTLPDNPIVFCNDAFLELTGYGRDDVLGRNCRFLQGPATRPADIREIGAAVGAPESIQIDILNYRKNGTTFWNALLVTPVFADGELSYFFASLVDVTERKRAEEHSVLLNRELDHRVKNTLATVQTIVLQTLKGAAVPSHVARAVAGRIQALARSHDVMTREAWASASITDVVLSALEPIREKLGNRIVIDGPDIRLRSRIATILSLAMHELGENAIRHGSLSIPSGTVAVRWSVGDGRLLLVWTEEGGPEVRMPSSKGYGGRIVERVLADEFGGSASIDYAPQGVVFTLDAPSKGLGVEPTEWSAP